MLMSVIEGALSAPAYPELAGKRVLITGLTSRCGVDVARAFAEHKGRLVLQFSESSEAMQTVAEIIAPSALEVEAYGPLARADDEGEVSEFARTASKVFGGLDIVVNLVPLEPRALAITATVEDVERLVAQNLAAPFLISRIAANRMSMMLTDGLVLNVATLAGAPRRARQTFAAVAKAALSALTRAQAEEWAGRGIRFNAVAPQTAVADAGGPRLAGEPDVASLALYLASGHGRTLSGCLFEAGMC
jgi:NAD(P)-dependent dehydrogenase (short-subunit alcohol dehydrogenase family)